MKNERIIEETLISNYPKYYRLAFSYARNASDAQDIVQEGAYKAILKAETLKNPDYADTWIYRIMINEAVSFIKKNQAASVSLDEANISTEDRYEAIEHMDLKDAVASLDPMDRTIVILRYFEDMKFEQIAQITSENQSTVKTRLYRALRKLGVLLAPEQTGSKT